MILCTSGLFLNAAHGQTPERTPRNVVVTRNVEYGRAGDRKLLLDIYQPPKRTDKELPAIVYIHGGGWATGNKKWGAMRLGSFVATGKYVGVSVGYRLSGEALWPAQIHDCKAAIRWIRANAEQHGIDPDRIGLWGNSAGGHLVSLLGTSSDVKELDGSNGSPGVSSRVKCVVDFCGPAEMAIFDERRANQLFGKPLEQRQPESKAASPTSYVTKDDPAFLIVHGTMDRTVPIAQSELFNRKLTEFGVDVTFVKIINGPHNPKGREVTNRVKTFFAKHLLNEDIEVSAEPIKAEIEQN